MQDDVLFSALTVWETVTTAALLRLPAATPTARKMQLAESVITELGNTVISIYLVIMLLSIDY